MKKIILNVFSTLSFITFSQFFDSLSQIVGTANDTHDNIITDVARNRCVTGQISGYTNFDPRAGSNNYSV